MTARRFCPFGEPPERRFKRDSALEKARRRDSMRAGFIFLNLLVGQTELPGQLGLRDPQHQSPLTDAVSNEAVQFAPTVCALARHRVPAREEVSAHSDSR